MRHQLDVARSFTGLKLAGFGVEPCCMRYPSAFPKAFASSNLSHPSLHQHALRFACLELPLAEDGVITFRIVDPADDLGVTYTPEVQQFRGARKDPHPDLLLLLGSSLRPEG